MTGRFARALAGGPLVLDAGLGTRLIALGLDVGHDDPVFWNVSRPENVRALHARDRAAGADAVVANTFGANRCWLSRWGREGEVELLNRRAVTLAREAVGHDGLVLGSVGPTAATDPGAALEQATLLADSGADAVLFETYRVDQALAALRAVTGSVVLPIIVSLVVWPDPVDRHARRLAEAGAAVLGTNCQLGVGPTLATVAALAGATGLPLLAKPSSGLPGDPLETPEQFARAVPRLLAHGVRLLGGCCGTTEAHVAALRAACYDRTSPTVRHGGANL